jgi:probable rRNA maturation factor
MLEIELSVQVDPAFRGKIDQEHLNKIILQTLRREGMAEPLTFGLLITDDEHIKRLNLRYRGQDRETDVLAFDMENSQNRFVSPHSVPVHLGDVVVSYARAVAQAETYGHSIEEELHRLVVHGLLHLLGYDDRSDEERQRMWDRQETILREFHTNV